MPSRRSGSGREALLEVQDGLGDPPGSPGVVGRPSRRTVSVRQATRRSGSGQEALSEDWECSAGHPEVREWSGGPPEVREWSGGPPAGPGVFSRPLGGPRVIGRPSRWSGSGQEVLLHFRE